MNGSYPKGSDDDVKPAFSAFDAEPDPDFWAIQYVAAYEPSIVEDGDDDGGDANGDGGDAVFGYAYSASIGIFVATIHDEVPETSAYWGDLDGFYSLLFLQTGGNCSGYITARERY